jgi:hypothetical protein
MPFDYLNPQGMTYTPDPQFSAVPQVMAPAGMQATQPNTGAQPIRSFMRTPEDFQNQLQNYSTIASQLISPYNVVGRNSWLAQNHPQLAGILDRAMTAAAMTPEAPGPEGAGGGISRAFQGVMGMEQMNRQKMMQAALLPYQMMMPMLQAQHLGAETGALESEIPYRHAMEQRAMAQSDYYMGRMAHMDTQEDIARQRMAIQQQHEDAWENTQEGRMNRLGQSLNLGTATIMKDTPQRPDETDEAYKARVSLGKAFMANMASVAGAKTTASDVASEPKRTEQALVSEARSSIGKNLTPVEKDPTKWITANATTLPPGVDPFKAHADALQKYQDQLNQDRQWTESYISSGAASKGISKSEWLKMQQNSGINVGAAATVNVPSTPSNSGSSWTPSR